MNSSQPNPLERHAFATAFVVGAVAVVWVAAAVAKSHPLVLMMAVVIGAVYALGAMELRRYRQATAGLSQALQGMPAEVLSLEGWLSGLHPSLHNPVRLRIEGERVVLPGPALTPNLVGLLVMLGMLGTFLGMVVTLNGAVFALEGSSNIQGIRAAFSEPIRGLGLAFGTSVAGVATSAMLGLMASLCRRERLQASQLLDTRIATTLRGFSLTHQRQETFKALQQQSQALPQVASQLQTMMAQMTQMHQQLQEQLLSNQQEFHHGVKSVYSELAQSVDGSLRSSLSQSMQVASDSIRPVVQATLAQLADEARVLHQRMVAATEGQLNTLSAQFSQSATTVADGWRAALDTHAQSSAQLVSSVGQSLENFTQTFETRSQALVTAVAQTQAGSQAEQAALDAQRFQAWTKLLQDMAAALRAEWQQTGSQTLAQQQALCQTLADTAQQLQAQSTAQANQTQADMEQLMGSAQTLLQARVNAEADWSSELQARAQTLMEMMRAELLSLRDAQTAWSSDHQAQAQALTELMRAELLTLRDAEAARAQAAVDRLGELQTAVTSHLGTLGTALEAPITRLIATASEAPKAAAEVIGQLRQEMSAGVARDNALLEERSRIMQTLNALLDAINHASSQQRATIDALVEGAQTALGQASEQFNQQASQESAKLTEVAAQLGGSAIEVASLGETFGFAVQSFSESNEKLMASLQRIEGALSQSLTRSDEQLAYYVAQAREIIELSIHSQKDLFEALQRKTTASAAPTRSAVAPVAPEVA